MTRRALIATASACALVCAGGGAHAQQASQSMPLAQSMAAAHAPVMQMDVGAWPKIGFETEADFEYDHVKPKGDKAGGALNVQGGNQTLIEFNNVFSISNLLTLQPGNELEPGKEKVLSDHELFAEELFARFNNQLVNVKVGKFAQNFARAWFLTPGLYGQDFVGDYAISETLGIEGQFDLGFPAYGLHQLSVSAFTADRTILSESLIHNRGRLHLSDGGPGNTKGLESFVVSYDGSNLPVGGHASLNYQLSAASLGKGEGADGRETRYAGGFNLDVPLAGGSVADTLRGRFKELRILGEAVHEDRADGLNGSKRDYLTGALEYVYGPWVFDLTTTTRWQQDAMTPRNHDVLWSGAVGYSLPSDTVVALGVASEKVGGQNGVFAGVSLSQVFTICDRCLIRGRHY